MSDKRSGGRDDCSLKNVNPTGEDFLYVLGSISKSGKYSQYSLCAGETLWQVVNGGSCPGNELRVVRGKQSKNTIQHILDGVVSIAAIIPNIWAKVSFLRLKLTVTS